LIEDLLVQWPLQSTQLFFVFMISARATLFSPVLLWRKIEGVWHTGISVYGFEYFFGGGIKKMYPQDVEEQFRLKPKDTIHLGYTSMCRNDFERFLQEIDSDFTMETYDLIKWNCNNFSDVCAKFLLGRGIPESIMSLPDVINRTLMGALIVKAVKAMAGNAPLSGSKVGNLTIEDRSARVASATKCRRLESQQRIGEDCIGNVPAHTGRRYSLPHANHYPQNPKLPRGATLIYPQRGIN